MVFLLGEVEKIIREGRREREREITPSGPMRPSVMAFLLENTENTCVQ